MPPRQGHALAGPGPPKRHRFPIAPKYVSRERTPNPGRDSARLDPTAQCLAERLCERLGAASLRLGVVRCCSLGRRPRARGRPGVSPWGNPPRSAAWWALFHFHASQQVFVVGMRCQPAPGFCPPREVHLPGSDGDSWATPFSGREEVAPEFPPTKSHRVEPASEATLRAVLPLNRNRGPPSGQLSGPGDPQRGARDGDPQGLARRGHPLAAQCVNIGVWAAGRSAPPRRPRIMRSLRTGDSPQ